LRFESLDLSIDRFFLNSDREFFWFERSNLFHKKIKVIKQNSNLWTSSERNFRLILLDWGIGMMFSDVKLQVTLRPARVAALAARVGLLVIV
jgi:hypothetical protein